MITRQHAHLRRQQEQQHQDNSQHCPSSTKIKACSDKEKAEADKWAVPGKAIPSLPPRQGGALTAVFSPARRSAAVRIVCWRQREADGGRAELGKRSYFAMEFITKKFLYIQINAIATTLAS